MRGTLVAILATLAFPAGAAACGMPLEAVVPSEQALITFADGREEIVASLALEDAGPKAAVVFPVPADAEVDVLAGEADLFGYLANVTNLAEDTDGGAAPGTAGSAPRGKGVEVVGREEIGGYDIARLRADDPGALTAYLDANGYTTPPGAEPILAEYVAEGWSYVAIKLAERQTEGALRPLRIAFPSEQIVYPKRLDALAPSSVATTIYVLAQDEVEIDPLRTEYAGPVSELAAPPPNEFAELFARAPYLTKLSSDTLTDQEIADDFVFELVGAARSDPGTRTWLLVTGAALALLGLAFIARAARRSGR